MTLQKCGNCGELVQNCACGRYITSPPVESSWERKYWDGFGDKFMEIARFADAGKDEKYGKALAALQIGIAKFIRETLAEREADIWGKIAALIPKGDYDEHTCHSGFCEADRYKKKVVEEILTALGKESI